MNYLDFEEYSGMNYLVVFLDRIFEGVFFVFSDGYIGGKLVVEVIIYGKSWWIMFLRGFVYLFIV